MAHQNTNRCGACDNHVTSDEPHRCTYSVGQSPFARSLRRSIRVNTDKAVAASDPAERARYTRRASDDMATLARITG
jgi:hypothetical protein